MSRASISGQAALFWVSSGYLLKFCSLLSGRHRVCVCVCVCVYVCMCVCVSHAHAPAFAEVTLVSGTLRTTSTTVSSDIVP